MWVKEERSGDHVGPAGQNTADLVERGEPWELGHAVGAESQDLVHLQGGRYTTGLATCQDPRVDPGLVFAIDLGPNQLHVGPVQNRPNRLDALVAGRPLNDPVAHPYTLAPFIQVRELGLARIDCVYNSVGNGSGRTQSDQVNRVMSAAHRGVPTELGLVHRAPQSCVSRHSG